MSYYNPYFFNVPLNTSAALNTPRVGLLTRLFGRSGATISSILNGTQRALNFANQAIPFVKQVRPMIGNAKTMFKVMNEFKKAEKPKNNYNSINNNYNNNNINHNHITNNEVNKNTSVNNINYDEGPTFFM